MKLCSKLKKIQREKSTVSNIEEKNPLSRGLARH
jgi:hypothetical protein